MELHADSKWGNKFYANLSRDLAEALPNVKSFSETNLKYMKYFYKLYSASVNRPQVGDDLRNIVSVFAKREDVEYFIHLANYEEVSGNDYNLSVSTHC